jgi:hypothetical protein
MVSILVSFPFIPNPLDNDVTLPAVSVDLITQLVLITKAIRANTQGSCYSTSTATKFLSVLNNVLTSVENGNAVVSEVSDQWTDAVFEITRCQLNNKICGESATEFTGVDFGVSFGIQDPAIAATYCGADFSVVNFGTGPQTSGCMQYECVKTPSQGVLDTTDLIAQDDKFQAISTVSQLNFINSVSSAIEPLVGAQVTVKIQLTSELIADYQLTDYDPSNLGSYELVPVSLTVNSDGSGVASSTTGVTLVGVSGGVVEMSAGTAGNFAVIVKNVGDVACTGSGCGGTDSTTTSGTTTPTETTEPTDPVGDAASSTGLIAGVVGALAAVLVGAGVLFAIRRRKQESSHGSKPEPIPTAAAAVATGNAVAINMDAELVDANAMVHEEIYARDVTEMPAYLTAPSYDMYTAANNEGRNIGPGMLN